MSHQLQLNRSTLVTILEAAFGPEDIVDLAKLNQVSIEAQDSARLSVFLPQLINSSIALHSTNAPDNVSVHYLDVYSLDAFADVFTEFLNDDEGFAELVEPTQVVISSHIPEVIKAYGQNCVQSPLSAYDPKNIRVAIDIVLEERVQDGVLPDLPNDFAKYDNAVILQLVLVG